MAATVPATDLPLGRPIQVAYVVADAAVAAARFAADHGAGPFILRPHIPVTDVLHRGVPGSFDHTSAYGQWGPIMVELVQQHDDRPSAVRDMYAPGEGGLHHVAMFCESLDAELDSWGNRVAMTARATTVRFAFVDLRDTLGHFLELYEPNDHLRRFYSRIAELADGWDGSDPVRPAG